jgi:hypothetical protein
MQLLKLTLQQASDYSGESLSVLHDAIRAGDLKSFVVGRRRFIRPEALKRWVDFLEKQSDKGTPVKYRAADPNERRV